MTRPHSAPTGDACPSCGMHAHNGWCRKCGQVKPVTESSPGEADRSSKKK